jgi:hypothetical protein
MKTRILFLMFFITFYGFSQTVNDYKAVIIPMKYDFQNDENQYRLQTISKVDLQKAGFKAFYADESIPAEFNDRCSLLYIDVKKDSGFLVSKLYVVLKDCFGTVVFKSETGKSREKEYQAAYAEALNLAFESIYALNYQYNGNTNFATKTVPYQSATTTVPVAAVAVTPTPEATIPPTSTPATQAVSPSVAVPVTATAVATTAAVAASIKEPKTSKGKTTNLLYAQPTSYGYQLIDSEPKVVMKVYKTSNPNSFMAKKGDVQGALVSKDNQWFFEYYQNDKLISEKIDVKF